MRETSYLTDNEKVLGILKKIDKFQPFSDSDLHSFLDLGKLKEYAPGEYIIREGEVDYWVYFLLVGEVEIVKEGESIKTLQRSGELFGEMGVIDGSPRSASIRAVTKCLMLGVDGSLLDRKNIENELAFNYTIFRLFAQVLAERLRLSTEEISRLKRDLDEKG